MAWKLKVDPGAATEVLAVAGAVKAKPRTVAAATCLVLFSWWVFPVFS